MFICVCKGVRKSDIEAAVKETGGATDTIEKLTGAGSECGTCVFRLKQVIKDMEDDLAQPATNKEVAG